MNYKYENSERLDPRLHSFINLIGDAPEKRNSTRDEAVAAANTPDAIAGREKWQQFVNLSDNEQIAPSKGLKIWSEKITSHPDNNSINLQIIRPDTDEILPCVYYIHGGAMSQLSCYLGNYRAWGKMIAAHGVAVVMVDFRNSVGPSSVEETGPFPCGLNDCLSGLRWLHNNSEKLRIDSSQVTVSGDSGGGNLSMALAITLNRSNELKLVAGLYLFCPYLMGDYPNDAFPSSIENNKILLDLDGNGPVLGYGIEHLEQRNPLAWPYFAQDSDLKGLPPVVISANECDPLRDENIFFYRKLLAAGVAARCRLIMGTMHATEMFLPTACPEISHDGAAHLALFAKK